MFISMMTIIIIIIIIFISLLREGADQERCAAGHRPAGADEGRSAELVSLRLCVMISASVNFVVAITYDDYYYY